MICRFLCACLLFPVIALAAGSTTPIAFPGQGDAWMDYLAFDPSTHSLWIPAGNRGVVFVLDTRTQTLKTTAALPTEKGSRHVMGPSSATVADGVVYVGNRAGNELCGFDAKTLQKQSCVKLPAMPDGLAYVATTHELWATTPRNHSLTIVALAKDEAMSIKDTVTVDGEPEGYAVDAQRGLFFTNLEDKDRTLVIDVKSRRVLSTFNPECGEAGPRGLALDAVEQRLFVACSDGARTLDLAHGGKIVGRLSTGGGVDNIDYAPKTQELFVPSGRDAKLAIVSVDKTGALKLAEQLPTSEGVRCAIADDAGNVYVADSKNARLLFARRAK